jgi:hypothetical protein
MVRKLKFIGILLFISWQYSQAQTLRSFSLERQKYPDELISYFGGNVEEDVDHFLTKFAQAWDTAYFSDAEKDKIILISNSLLKKKARPLPHFFLFINIAQKVCGKGKLNQFSNTWLDYFASQASDLEISVNNHERLMRSFLNLIDNNIIFTSPALTWKARNNNFELSVQNNLTAIYPATSLVCYSKSDSIEINGTKGVLNLNQNTWDGNDGVVDWTRAKYSLQEIKAELSRYHIDLTQSTYIADSVWLTYPRYFKEKVLGKIEDKVMNLSSKSRISYPQFFSYKQTFDIKNIYPNINYIGGFSVQGERLIGTGVKETPANLLFYHKDTLKFKVSSRFLIFSSEKVVGSNSGVTIYLDRDSMSHANVSFSFSIKDNELTLEKTDAFKTMFPYTNTYHKVDMDFDQLKWKINEPYIHFSIPQGKSIGRARFESLNFFNYNTFENLFGLGYVHPLSSLKQFSLQVKRNTFTATEYANYRRMDLSEIRHLMLQMAYSGYIFFDTETDVITLRQKLFDNLSASIGRIDYDVMNFVSLTYAPQDNALLDLRNFDLTINGIDVIALSDSQNVIIYPKNAQIIMKKNRSFQFAGVVDAGLLTFYGANFFFDYENFKINLQNVDSMAIKIKTEQLDQYSRNMLAQVSNMIEHLTGELLIDDPHNKSGLKNHPNYPIFESKEKSYVYYDDKKIQHGVYDRKRFYFEVEPFIIDSLDNFAAKEMAYKGTLYSDIFEPIQHKLKIQKDNSLGLNMYKTNTLFKDTVTLSSKGFKGKGRMFLMSSELVSRDFNLYPDSVNVLADNFAMKEMTTGPLYPKVIALKTYVHYEPKDSLMTVSQTDSPFDIYNGKLILTGKLNIKPTGMTGNGKAQMDEVYLTSNRYDFRTKTYTADSSSLYIKSNTSESASLIASNLFSTIDFNNSSGNFKMLNDTSKIVFQANKYTASIAQFKWFMKDKKVVFESKASHKGLSGLWWDEGIDENLTGTVFTSTDPKQNKLDFVSPSLSLDYTQNTLTANKVKYIEVADAVILPKDEIIEVADGGHIKKLTESRILANTTSQYHRLFDATVDIYGKQAFYGAASCHYVDENNVKELINFTEVKTDSVGQTVAWADIDETSPFTLSSHFDFKGKVYLKAQRKNLDFYGFTTIKQNCREDMSNWFAFHSVIDPMDVKIPVGSPIVNPSGSKLYNGYFMATDSIYVYASFLTAQKYYSDKLMATADGVVYYNKELSKYQIAPEPRLKNEFFDGNYMELDSTNCTLKFEGGFDLQANLGLLKLDYGGIIQHKIADNNFEFNMAMSMNFPMLESAMMVMASDLDSLSNAPMGDLTLAERRKSLIGLYGSGKTSSLNATIEQAKKEKGLLPKELRQTIVFSDVNMVWNPKTRSYRNQGKIGVLSILGKPINRQFDGYIEISRKRSGDIMDVYIKVNDNLWYYFGYTTGVMQVLSTNRAFNEPIQALKVDKRTTQPEKNQIGFVYMVSTNQKKEMFIRRFINDNKKEEEEKVEGENAGQPAENQPNSDKASPTE